MTQSVQPDSTLMCAEPVTGLHDLKVTHCTLKLQSDNMTIWKPDLTLQDTAGLMTSPVLFDHKYVPRHTRSTTVKPSQTWSILMLNCGCVLSHLA
jgi:hypothetical protein